MQNRVGRISQITEEHPGRLILRKSVRDEPHRPVPHLDLRLVSHHRRECARRVGWRRFGEPPTGRDFTSKRAFARFGDEVF